MRVQVQTFPPETHMPTGIRLFDRRQASETITASVGDRGELAVDRLHNHRCRALEKIADDGHPTIDDRRAAHGSFRIDQIDSAVPTNAPIAIDIRNAKLRPFEKGGILLDAHVTAGLAAVSC